MDFPKVEPGSGSEIGPTSHDGDRVSDIKVQASDTEEEEDPLLVTLPGINAEIEVSCVSSYVF
jgi:hypothetical protein